MWSDHRVRALSRMIGSDAMAIGCLIMAWHTAQEFYLINGVGMPKDQFYLLEHADKMKACLLAEERDEFVYLAGSKEQFGWLISAKNSGQNGGRERVRRENLKKEQEKDGFVDFIKESVKGPLSDPQATLKRALSESNPLYSLLSSPNTNTKTIEQNPVRKAHLDFNILYQNYPRKRGKSPGIKKCTTQVKTMERYELLKVAIDNYAAHCQNEGVENKFRKHFSTFMNEWEDWIDYKPEESLGVKKLPRAPAVTSAY